MLPSSVMEMVLFVVGLWVTPSILLSAVVVYQALRHDWREAPPIAWTGRAYDRTYGIVGMEQLIELTPTQRRTLRSTQRSTARGPERKPTSRGRDHMEREGDRAGIRHESDPSKQPLFSGKRADEAERI